MAAPPCWAVKVANDIRKAAVVASKAKSASNAMLSLSKSSRALPDAEIEKFSQTLNTQGLKALNKIIGKSEAIARCGDDARHLVLQNAYLRIAMRNKVLSADKAEEIFSRLGGTPGLTSLLSKINSTNFSQAKGHLRELEIALEARKRGFEVVSLGQRYYDGLKKAETDLDVLLKKGSKIFAIESKAYAGLVPDVMVKSDAESLVVFCSQIKNSIPVFCFDSSPSLIAQSFLSKRGVRCLTGSPKEIMTKLDVISSIE